MGEHEQFVERVVARLASTPPTAFTFQHWSFAGRPTDETFALMPVSGADPDKLLAAVMDVDHYVGNVDHVVESRSIADPRYASPDHVRFYQRVNIPLLGAVHHELVLHRLGPRNGYAIAAWELLAPETDKLDAKKGIRSDHNVGAWLVAPGVVGYCLASTPKRDDVGFIKWKALTTGAGLTASVVLKNNIEGMARWAARR